ncbi:hypothetical protein D3C73_1585000 [compost metagenome]
MWYLLSALSLRICNSFNFFDSTCCCCAVGMSCVGVGSSPVPAAKALDASNPVKIRERVVLFKILLKFMKNPPKQYD